MTSKCIFNCLILIFSSLIAEVLVAQQSGYQLPPQAIVDIVDAKPTPTVSLSPDNEWMLMVCLLYTSPSPRDRTRSRMPSSA